METGKRTKEESGERIDKIDKKIGGDFVVTKNPAYIAHRLKILAPLLAEQKSLIEAKEKPEISIVIKYNGEEKKIKGNAFKTTVFNAAKKANKKWAKNAIVSKVAYVLEGHEEKKGNNFISIK